MSKTGGIGETKEPDNTVHEICEKVREEVENKSGQKFTEFTAIKYKTQLVNGVNYFIKVRVNEGQYLHIRAHKSFGGEITFANHQQNKTLEEDIAYFDLN